MNYKQYIPSYNTVTKVGSTAYRGSSNAISLGNKTGGLLSNNLMIILVILVIYHYYKKGKDEGKSESTGTTIPDFIPSGVNPQRLTELQNLAIVLESELTKFNVDETKVVNLITTIKSDDEFKYVLISVGEVGSWWSTADNESLISRLNLVLNTNEKKTIKPYLYSYQNRLT